MTGTLVDGSAVENRLFTGSWTRSGGDPFDVREPSTGEVLATVPASTADDVAESTAAAAQATTAWAALPFTERAAVLRRAGDLVDTHRSELTYWLVREGGGSHGKTGAELARTQEELHEAAAMLSQPVGQILPSPHSGRRSYARRVPLGVVGVIAPWNFPLLLAIRSVAPALALGNAVVLKPDPQTPISGGILIARLLEAAGLPEGVFEVVLGGAHTGEALVTDPRVAMISFTGSTRAGRRVGELAGGALKRVSLELGGNNALIVLEDADVDLAASAGAWAGFLHQGQVCISSSRHLVHESISEQYAEALVRRAEALKVGDPLRDDAALGPIINERQLAGIEAAVAESVAAGARVRTGGQAQAPYYPATVLDRVTPSMSVFATEVFGPVAPIATFRGDDEAVWLANGTEYGLAAAVHSRDTGRAMAIADRLHVGMVHVNDTTMSDQAHVPFGGFGVSGNGGAFGGTANWEQFTHWQWITVRDQAIPTPLDAALRG